MLRRFFFWVGGPLGLAVGSAILGCSMCQDCYDDSPPVVSGLPGDGYITGGRAGSVTSGVEELQFEQDELGAAEVVADEQ